MTTEGIKKEKDVDRSQSITPKTGRKLDFVIIGVLVTALGYFAWDKFMLRDGDDAASVDEVTQAADESMQPISPQSDGMVERMN